MKVSLEWFLLDNFAVNWLLLKLAGARSEEHTSELQSRE